MGLVVLICFCLGTIFLGAAVGTVTTGVEAFVSLRALFVVFGGTLTAALIAFTPSRLWSICLVFVSRFLYKSQTNLGHLLEDLVRLSKAHTQNPKEFENALNNSRDPFLKESMRLLTDELMDEETLTRVIRSRAQLLYRRQLEQAQKIKTLAKFPPAFGLLGTTWGIIVLLQGVGASNALTLIPEFAVALVATLYGIGLSHLLLYPMAENLSDSAKDYLLKNTIIAEGARLMAKRTNPLVMAEELNSYLMPADRVRWTDFVEDETRRAAA